MSYNINQMHFPSTQIYLNSKYADAYGGDPSKRSWCYFIFKEPIVKLPEAYNFLISLNSIELPCSMYAVNSTNNVIRFSYTYFDSNYGSNRTFNTPFTIPPGNYSAIDLAATISFSLGLFSSSPCSISTLYNQQNNKFHFRLIGIPLTFTNYFSFNIDASLPNCIAGLSGVMLSSSTRDISGNFNLYSDVCVDLAGTRAVFVKCMNIHTPAYDSRSKYSGTTLARVPVVQEPFGITFWKNDTQFKCACSIKNISNLEIQIFDEFGSLIDFNLVDWTLTLQLDIINATDESLTDFTPNIPFINNHM